ncbi:DUF397 domain-containing protein [Streptomyces daliensis]
MNDTLRWFKSSYSDSGGGECVEIAFDWRKSSYSDDSGGQCVEVALGWHKSSHSDSGGGNCVEVAFGWHKSSYSSPNGGDCVEVAACGCPDPAVHIRDSKAGEDGPTLTVPAAAWTAFAAYVS